MCESQQLSSNMNTGSSFAKLLRYGYFKISSENPSITFEKVMDDAEFPNAISKNFRSNLFQFRQKLRSLLGHSTSEKDPKLSTCSCALKKCSSLQGQRTIGVPFAQMMSSFRFISV
ncbi:hypothetical protein CEXT_92151 [Caerostris extrusa]|uniref:Uncharacterized protein n=1 Tax=Caerostris extrusa TaxID=172846 RepID=A0AAV4UHJ8_CAEEX|nr:hypothetical protein CEXT_92151 [Caerostris extrusa]